MDTQQETIQVTVVATSFRNEENGYSVIRIQKGREELAAVGVMP